MSAAESHVVTFGDDDVVIWKGVVNLYYFKVDDDVPEQRQNEIHKRLEQLLGCEVYKVQS